eukprot:GHVR01059678.1.p1 GENE.GHVR01059678.1~~GHVR01059678.1.p1  ORF type:complete len:253 (+),score=56.84 GHVR01059678.1:198-956(+)
MLNNILNEEESIYKIIPPDPVIRDRRQLYKSIHNPLLKPTKSTFEAPTPSLVKSLSTQIPLSPRNFLKKGEKLRQSKETATDQCTHIKIKHHPPVPHASITSSVSNKTTKNFITTNAVNVILSAPKKLKNSLDSKDKNFLHKEDYGCVPAYVEKVKSDIKEEKEYVRKLQQSHNNAQLNNIRLVSDIERQEILEGLKRNWEHTNSLYSMFSHVTILSTIGKTKKKEGYELQLQQLEKDIEKMSKNIIFTDND